jgi:hypothetical protein
VTPVSGSDRRHAARRIRARNLRRRAAKAVRRGRSGAPFASDDALGFVAVVAAVHAQAVQLWAPEVAVEWLVRLTCSVQTVPCVSLKRSTPRAAVFTRNPAITDT